MRLFLRRARWLGLAIMVVGSTACSGGKPSDIPRKVRLDACVPSFVPDPVRAPDVDTALPDASDPVRKRFSARSVRAAEAIYALDTLEELARLGVDAFDTPAATRLHLDVLERITYARIQLTIARAEAACETERTRAVERHLENARDIHVDRLTIGSLIVAAGSAIVAGVVDLENPDSKLPPILGIGGGIGSAAIGAAALVPYQARMEVRHERNLLRDIWEGPRQSDQFPPVVWRLMTRAGVQGEGEDSPRATLAARWRARFEGNPRRRELLFGRGGNYDLDDMRVREELLDALEPEIDRVNEALARLSSELSELEHHAPKAP